MYLIQYTLFKLYDYNQFRTMNQNKLVYTKQPQPNNQVDAIIPLFLFLNL